MSTLIEFSIFPLGKGESVSQYVARMVKIIDASGLPYKFGPMSTCVEGDFDEVMDLAARCHEALRPDCDRIILNLKADYRKEGADRIHSKIKSVETKLGRKL